MKIFQMLIQHKFYENSIRVSRIVTPERLDVAKLIEAFVHLSFANTSKKTCAEEETLN